ncbi:MAG: hypothetical protein WCS65_07565 [Verrucomicrobiae bacterium]
MSFFFSLPTASAQDVIGALAPASFVSDVSAQGSMPASAPMLGRPTRLGGAGGNKSSLAGWQAYRNYRAGPSGSSSEVARIGQVKMSFGASGGVSYDTNVNSSPTAPLADLSVDLGMNLGLYWKATRRNDLQLNLGMNYTKYLQYPQYNAGGLIIDPNTGLDYRLYFQDFVLTLYDYPSITNSGAAQDPAITNSVNFRQLANRGGLSLLWHANRLVFMTGAERQDTLSLTDEEFSSQNSTGYSWYGVVSCDITPTTSAGIRLQASSTEYTQQVMNNSVAAQAGIFYQSRLTEYTSITFEAGMQAATFSSTGKQSDQLTYQESNGFNTDVTSTLGGTNYAQPYFLLTLMNRLNRHLSHSLSLSREAAGSSVANYQEINSASYGLQYRLNRVIKTALYLNYEFGTISRTAGAMPYSNFTGGLNVSFQIMKNTDFGIGYTYYKNEQSQLAADYTRQVLTLSVSHQF